MKKENKQVPTTTTTKQKKEKKTKNKKSFFNKIRHPFISFFDWYIEKYHSKEYIHRDMILDEIKNKIKAAEDRLNSFRDEQEENKLYNARLQYQIKEDGYLAEMQNMIEKDKRRKEHHKEVIELYYKIKRWGKDLAIVTSLNKHYGEEITGNVGKYLGKLDDISISSDSVLKEIKNDEKDDENILEM